MSAGQHLAHFNWATLNASFDDPSVAEFVDALEAVNAVAERSPGFVWRHGDEAGEAIRLGWPLFVDNRRLIASFSVWETLEALETYVYKTVHGAFVRRRDAWFLTPETYNYALWWVPAGHVPTIPEARERVEALLAGAGPETVFTFQHGRAAE